MLTALVLTALLAQAPAANQADGGPLPSGTPAATTPATRDAPTVQSRSTENSPLPKVPEGTAGSTVLEPGKSPVEPDRQALPKSVSDVPLAPLGPAPPASTGTTEKQGTGKTGGGANRVDSIR
jgi:hypothetical protein